jgi:glycosyltransferase involved in cell wall biosynthesis
MKQSKIKLLHITSSLKMGGAERVLYEVVTSLDPARYEQSVVYFHGGPYEQLFKDKNIPVIAINGCLFRYDPLFWYRFYKEVKKFKPDLLHTLLWMANVAGRLIGYFLKIPTCSVIHNNVTQDGAVRSAIDYITLGFHDVIIAVSPEVKDSLCKRNIKLKSENIHIISNGICVDRYASAAIAARNQRAVFNSTDNHFVIGSVGRFVPVKQYDLLLYSFAQIHQLFPHAILMLVGTGPLEHSLRKLAVSLQISHCVDFIINKQAIDYYGLFDCFVMTSAQEGISLALLEAMSSSLPCVVTNMQAPQHTVLTHRYNGLVVPAHSQEALVAHLAEVISDKEMRVNLGQMAYKTSSDQYTQEAMVAKYDKIFKLMQR